MQVVLMIKGDPQPGAAPGEELLGAMGRYNDDLKQAGVLLELAGLLPSVQGGGSGFRGNRTVSAVPGPSTAPHIPINAWHVDGNKALIYAHLAEMVAPATGSGRVGWMVSVSRGGVKPWPLAHQVFTCSTSPLVDVQVQRSTISAGAPQSGCGQ